jgi:muramoyltetrapeptide carboxypeptidase
LKNKILIPKKLKKGDLIGIISPSDPIKNPKMDLQFQKGISFLENMGFKTKLGKNISSDNPKLKAQDINDFFNDESINAIICSKGGDSAEKTLKYINFDLIKNNPKIFMGLSDITVFLNAIYKKTNLITFHGNEVKYGFGREYYKYNEQEFLNRIIKGKKGLIKPNGIRTTIRTGKVEGKLLGGNLRCLLKLSKTTYWPEFKGAILFLESLHLTPENCYKYFKQLNELETFKKINGVIVGFNFGMQVEHPKEEQMETILKKVTKKYSFPILKVNDFGHNCANTVLPVGTKIILDATNKKIELVENYIK